MFTFTVPKNFKHLTKMKKILTTLSFVLGLGLATAQQTAEKQTTLPPSPPKEVVKKTTKPAAKTKTTVTRTEVKMKKDGTPDKRYKANQYLKKDGTRDKRFKTK